MVAHQSDGSIAASVGGAYCFMVAVEVIPHRSTCTCECSIMNEVTNQNFSKVYPHLEATLKNASFIAIDGEFTGITGDDVKNSLFDTTKERYEKQRGVIQPYIVIQFGIAAFQRVPDKNEYTTEAFNFFLLPKSTPLKSRQFIWQTAALEFLATYEFDFNKLAYEGISYLDEAGEATLEQQLRNDVLSRNLERHMLIMEDYNIHKDNVNRVTEWLQTACHENSLKIDTRTPFLQYLMHRELRSRFPNTWTLSGDNSVTVIKVEPDVRKVLERDEGSVLENVLLDSYIGFSKVFKLLVTLKKPVIAHNAFLDLMFMYQQFYKPLPSRYSKFKDNVHQLFPTIYDTKFLSYRLRDILQGDVWKINSLSGLFDYFTGEKGRHVILGSPLIKSATQSDSKNSDAATSPKYHTAGWDAYTAGCVFLKIAHVFAGKRNGEQKSLTVKYFTHTELMNSVKHYANCINIIRCNISYMKLDGPDPETTRPKWLYVKTLVPQPITSLQVAEKMSTFGTVDVKQYTSNRMLVAVTNHRSAKEILQHFQQNKEIYVAPYSPLRHSRSVQFAFLCRSRDSTCLANCCEGIVTTRSWRERVRDAVRCRAFSSLLFRVSAQHINRYINSRFFPL
ncbi:pre-piRNA 3'-exonuclease trimmer isoform X2 [Ooceraea biroi]|uniref:pre-piRNA 3'-exonuclease trimmer isoform X2 n=1 Tax=Ooceraea biroi TaxID=2015173 RepID=UPI000F089F54|nr:pre-piRNA 3'-exonuclease trimmer isoform X2 [Ooceraea biroi]